MNDRNDTGRNDGARTIEEEVSDQATILKETFGLAPETARITAEDKVASRMRNPASDDVEADRIAAAKEQADTEAVEAERRSAVDDGAENTSFEIDPNAQIIKNIDESVERAAW